MPEDGSEGAPMLYQAYKALVRLSNVLFAIEKIFLFAAVFVVVAVNFANVCLRYLASYSLNYCETLSVALFMFMVLIGANLAIKTDSEIKIEFFKSQNPKKDGLLKIVPDLLCLVTIIVCLLGLFDTIEAVMRNKQRLTPLPVYTYHVYIVMTIGFFLALIDRMILTLKHSCQIFGFEIKDEVASA